MKTYVVLPLLCILMCSGCASLPKGKFIPLETLKKHRAKQTMDKEVQNSEERQESNEWVEAQTQKVWVNAHVDKQGNLIEGHYEHIILNPGHWSVTDGRTNARSASNISVQ